MFSFGKGQVNAFDIEHLLKKSPQRPGTASVFDKLLVLWYFKRASQARSIANSCNLISEIFRRRPLSVLNKKTPAGPYGQTAIILFFLLIFLLAVLCIGIGLSWLEAPPPIAPQKNQTACYSICSAVS